MPLTEVGGGSLIEWGTLDQWLKPLTLHANTQGSEPEFDLAGLSEEFTPHFISTPKIVNNLQPFVTWERVNSLGYVST